MAECGSNDRFNEKSQLQELNERFCHYVQNMKCLTDQLEMGDNSNDMKRIQELEEEIVSARNLYNKEIQGLHEQLNQNCKERMQIEINNLKNSQLIADFRESILALNTAILQKEEEKKNLELLLCQKEAELRELQASAGKPAMELEELRRELQQLHLCLEEVQKKYEKEHRLNQELQATIHQLRCKLDLQHENHCQDMACMREKAAEAEALILELEEKLRRASMDDGGVMELLRKIREANNAEMQQYRYQTEQNYNQNVMDLTLCLNKERMQLEQIQQENQCLRQHVNNLTTEIKLLQDKLLSEEENKVALVTKLNCDQQKSQQHINDLKTRLEEVEDLLLAKMKELHCRMGANMPSLQGDIASFKCMLEAEERRLNSSMVCCKRSSPCKPSLPCPRTPCPSTNQSAPRRGSTSSCCPPVNLRPCPPPCPMPTPFKPVQRLDAPYPPVLPPSSALSTRLPAYQPPCPPPHSLVACLAGMRPPCPPSCSLPPSRMGCSVGRPMTPTCLPTARMGCPSTSPLALYTTMLQARCPSTPPLTCPPANPMPSCNPPPPRPCSVASPYPKPCPPTEMPRFKHDHCMVPVCCNGEPQKDCTKPPPLPASLTSCKSGQGNDFFSNMIRELNRNGVCSKFPPSKPVVTPCNPNTPTASTIGNMKIVEVSTNGHFVRILNISPNAEEDIGNYVLQQNIGGQPVAMYRFPPRTYECVSALA
ncbi:lamin-B2-like [Leucoraja erinacea]|uniref:lamin-B2-like n=1 Tax=Leucoraja erinaceus TaxID=7782 RepID=UPI002454E964|nr:lamin-B2-like [Leucoraja erinacea]